MRPHKRLLVNGRPLVATVLQAEVLVLAKELEPLLPSRDDAVCRQILCHFSAMAGALEERSRRQKRDRSRLDDDSIQLPVDRSSDSVQLVDKEADESQPKRCGVAELLDDKPTRSGAQQQAALEQVSVLCVGQHEPAVNVQAASAGRKPDDLHLADLLECGDLQLLLAVQGSDAPQDNFHLQEVPPSFNHAAPLGFDNIIEPSTATLAVHDNDVSGDVSGVLTPVMCFVAFLTTCRTLPKEAASRCATRVRSPIVIS